MYDVECTVKIHDLFNWFEHGEETYRIAGNICEGKSWRKCKIWHIGGLNLADLRLYISHTHSFKLLTRVSMEGEADMTKFVLESIVWRISCVPDDLGSFNW